MSSDVLTAFGNAVREARLKTGLSQEALAFECGVHRTYISLIERGGGNATIEVLFRLAVALKMPVTQIIALAEDKYKTATQKKTPDYRGLK